jgi:DeoR/GlpR family transcriptional regulator of sugar metabolism
VSLKAERAKLILDFLNEHGPATSREIAAELSDALWVPARQLRRSVRDSLDYLVESGAVVKADGRVVRNDNRHYGQKEKEVTVPFFSAKT